MSKADKPNRKTVMTRIDEQIHRKLSAYKDKNITDTIEFEMIDGSEYELAAALHSLTDDKHGS